MTLEQAVAELNKQYEILGVVSLDIVEDNPDVYYQRLEDEFRGLWRAEFAQNQRIIVTQTTEKYYAGTAFYLNTLQAVVNQVDISNPFIVVVSSNPNLARDLAAAHSTSTDPGVMGSVQVTDSEFMAEYNERSVNVRYRYGSALPAKIALNELTDREKFLLTESKTFCIYPWIHLIALPNGEVYPCCYSRKGNPKGNNHKSSLNEIWQADPMQQLRNDMLNERQNPNCTHCYEQEAAGSFSGRLSANKHHGHHVKRIDDPEFKMYYWDIRFSNLCNLSCRSCSPVFSSSWYQDQAQLMGVTWAKENSALNHAGRHETDMWEQLEPHLDYVERIYFAGGEPMLMIEHYNILEELVRRGRFDVQLIYNTNFTHTQLKDQSVFEYWRLFNNVSIGASLDAQGQRAEYIRHGSDWAKIVENRQQMKQVCPNVDFYVNLTLSILNADHAADFHRAWVELELIEPKDFNVSILQSPAYYRIDIATPEYKDQLRAKFEQHLNWLRPQDTLQRATVGFEAAIKFMTATDNSQLLPEFWQRTHALDQLRKEDVLTTLPELTVLK